MFGMFDVRFGPGGCMPDVEDPRFDIQYIDALLVRDVSTSQERDWNKSITNEPIQNTSATMDIT